MFPTVHGIVNQGGGNWWEAGGASGAVAVYQPIGAASLAASYTDLSGNGNDAAPVATAPSWDAANGWYIDSSVGHLITPILLNANSSFLIKYNTISGNGRRVFGLSETGVGVYYYSPVNNAVWVNGTGYTQTGISAGVAGIAGSGAWANGIKVDDTLAGITGTSTINPYIGAQNVDGVASLRYFGYIAAFVAWPTKQSDAAMAAVSAAMAAL